MTKEITKKLTLMSKERGLEVSKKHTTIEGLYLSELTPKIRQTYQIRNSIQGVLIEDIVAQSNSHLSGFRPYDIIIQIENFNISSIKELRNAFTKYKGKQKRVYVNRDNYIILLVTQ